jgi:glycosyltransferase involved in cell wall biosynthesis
MSKQQVVMVEIAGKGGICHYTYNLVQALSSGNDVVLVTGKNYELQDKPRSFKLLEVFNRFRTSPFFVFDFFNAVRGKNVACVHFQLCQHPFVVLSMIRFLKAFLRKPVVVTAHNVISHESKKEEIKTFSAIYRLVDRIIVHSQNSKHDLECMFKVNPDKISVIPHGNYTFFNNDVSCVPPGSCNILFFGFIREYKGLMYLIQALKMIREKLPKAKLLIVGKPLEPFEPYQKEIIRLGLADAVETVLDYLPTERFGEFFNRANVVVLPYTQIYQSGILQLAYGFARPVVVTDVGGLSEVVIDGKTGFIVPAKNSEALAEKTTLILQDEALQKSMGEQAYQLAKTEYSWEAIAEKTDKLYCGL